MSAAVPMAMTAGLVSCHSCGEVYSKHAIPAGHHAHCSLCGGRLHSRKTNSLARTWALVLSGLILYIPANLYPIMTVIISGSGESDTIVSGVIALFGAGMWEIAALVLFASILVPVLKLVGLTYLLLSVHFKSEWRPADRTFLYRVINGIGRWSMIDMFMLSVLVALVKLGAVATIEPGIGATSFAAVVVVTIFAAGSFDPRLIWDAMDKKTG